MAAHAVEQRLAWVAVALATGLAGADAWVAAIDPTGLAAADVGAVGLEVLLCVVCTGVGALLVSRRARPIGWLLSTIGSSFALLVTSQRLASYVEHTEGHVTSAARWLFWVGNWAWTPGVVAGVLFIPMLYPSGRAQSRRWALAARLAVVGAVLVTVGEALQPGALESPSTVQSPLHPPGVVGSVATAAANLFIPLTLLAVASIVSLVRRYRRSRGIERQQYKWLAVAAGLLVLGFAGNVAAGEGWGWPAFLAGFLALPVAVAVAVLRYRLYDIDRLISRTVSYALVSGVLVSVYVGCVTLTTNAAGMSSAPGVAVATLVAAALFQPLRRRVQVRVDRRFNRERFDAAALVDAFAGRVRVSVELEHLVADLTTTVSGAVAPTTVSVWTP